MLKLTSLFFPARRTPLAPYSKAELAHIKHVGEIIFAWNSAHTPLFEIFSIIGANRDHALALEIWNSHGGDNAQRVMLRKLAHRMPSQSLERALCWSISCLDELGRHRNDAVHLAPLQGFEEIVPGPQTKPASLARLDFTPVSKLHKPLCGDLYGITGYLNGVFWALNLGHARPLSHRPSLRLARTKTQHAQSQRRQAKSKARQRQREAFPPLPQSQRP